MRNTSGSRKRLVVALSVAAFWFALGRGPVPVEAQTCAGDCDGDGVLGVAECRQRWERLG
jgi:hypothetical protein